MVNYFTKFHLFKTILFNSRLEDYKFFLSNAKEHGYQIIPLCDFYDLGERRNGKHLVLRHDVDFNGKNVRKMFETEMMGGTKSTYYFRFSTIDKDLINEMIKAGFEVGLHYETIADIIRERNYTSKEQIDMNYARNRFKEDIKRFEDNIGHKIVSCCSHGAPENIKLGISNNFLTEGVKMSIYDLHFEAYDKIMYDNDIDCHIMDNSLMFNYGFSYRDNPINAVEHGLQNILFLSHPNHWYFTTPNQMKKLAGLFLGAAKFDTNRVFKRMEV